jgi:hypothetical protein
MVKGEPQSAGDYLPRSFTAVRQTLAEIAQILGSFQGRFAVIGGAVPWLLLHPEDMVHIGTLDIDLALDPQALAGTEYAELVDVLRGHGYNQREGARAFQLVREVPATDEGPPIDVYVDFLMPRNAVVEKRDTPLIKDFAVQRADGADLAIDFQTMVGIEEAMPGSAEIRFLRSASVIVGSMHHLEARLAFRPVRFWSFACGKRMATSGAASLGPLALA